MAAALEAMAQVEETIQFPSIESAIALAGPHEQNLKTLAQQTGAQLVMRGQDLYISGEDRCVQRCLELVRSLQPYWREGSPISQADLQTALQAQDTERWSDYRDLQQDVLARTRRGDVIRAKTFQQQAYVRAIQQHDVTFCTGPAGTGKTFLAAVLAVQALLNGHYERLILTRPALEAGEKLGFLPGDLQQKVNPFLRPLYDALYELVDPAKIPDLMARGTIEVAPLAYMRGRTLNRAFVIVDEAQNTTPAQLKMVLTRLGFAASMAVTGDITQTDLPQNQASGLVVALDILQGVEGVAICRLTEADVVRHPVVQRIVDAYNRYEGSQG